MIEHDHGEEGQRCEYHNYLHPGRLISSQRIRDRNQKNRDEHADHIAEDGAGDSHFAALLRALRADRHQGAVGNRDRSVNNSGCQRIGNQDIGVLRTGGDSLRNGEQQNHRYRHRDRHNPEPGPALAVLEMAGIHDLAHQQIRKRIQHLRDDEHRRRGGSRKPDLLRVKISELSDEAAHRIQRQLPDAIAEIIPGPHGLLNPHAVFSQLLCHDFLPAAVRLRPCHIVRCYDYRRIAAHHIAIMFYAL